MILIDAERLAASRPNRPLFNDVSVTIADGAMAVDFAGSSAQVRGPFNVVPSGSLAAACYVVRAITDPTIPTNGAKTPIREQATSSNDGSGGNAQA